jgi:outer membrane lipopolysaccharide assembly protein LptE/RlpB
MRKLAICAAILTLLAVFVGCGYHTAGHVATVPQDVHTIAIPAFVNQTQTYRIEQRLTAAVVQEMATRTHYRVVSEPNDADAILRGTVLSTNSAPLTYNTQTGQVSSILVSVGIKVTFTGKDGKVLYQNPSYLFRQQYQVSSDPPSFFEEDSPAFERLSREFARTLVSNVLEGF